jgi:hypothetical protein
MDLLLWRQRQIHRAVDTKSDGAMGHQLLWRSHSCRRWNNRIYLSIFRLQFNGSSFLCLYLCILLWHIIEYCPVIFPKDWGKLWKFPSLDRRCSGRDSNPASPEYKSRALRLHQPAQLIVYYNIITVVSATILHFKVLKNFRLKVKN